jgi:hypothetical protein
LKYLLKIMTTKNKDKITGGVKAPTTMKGNKQ